MPVPPPKPNTYCSTAQKRGDREYQTLRRITHMHTTQAVPHLQRATESKRQNATEQPVSCLPAQLRAARGTWQPGHRALPYSGVTQAPSQPLGWHRHSSESAPSSASAIKGRCTRVNSCFSHPNLTWLYLLTLKITFFKCHPTQLLGSHETLP